jgi:hypothetical protein
MDRNSPTFAGEVKTLTAMLRIYCRGRHGGGRELCGECRELQVYAEGKLEKCRFGDRKPKCSQCPVHCYKPAMRERIREVMQYAGPRMMTRHPVLAVRHIAQGVLRRPPQLTKEPQ